MTDYDFEERSAILEFDAGFTREEAEKKAREIIDKWRETFEILAPLDGEEKPK